MNKHIKLICALLLLRLGAIASPTLTISSGLPTDTTCYGALVNFTATPSISGTYGYIWNVNGTFVGSSSPLYSTSTLPHGLDAIYCVLTNAAGDTIYDHSDTLIVLVDSLPANAPITVPSVPAGVCVGDTLQLTDAVPGGVWASSNPAAATVSSTGVVTGVGLPTGGPPTVRIYYIMTNSCGSDSSRVNVQVAVPASEIMISSTTICIDSSVVIADSARGGLWATDDSTIGSVSAVFGPGGPPTEMFTGHAVGTVVITYSGTNACGTYSKTVTVNVVDCSTAGVEDQSATSGWNVYPNPTDGVINIASKGNKTGDATCMVTDLAGRVLVTKTITAGRGALTLDAPAGLYFVQVAANGTRQNFTIVHK